MRFSYNSYILKILYSCIIKCNGVIIKKMSIQEKWNNYFFQVFCLILLSKMPYHVNFQKFEIENSDNIFNFEQRYETFLACDI